MKKFLLFVLCFVLCAGTANAELPLIGFYKTVDDSTGKSTAVVRLYECGDYMCGRIVALFDETGTTIAETIRNPIRVADKVKGKPKVDGLDIIWNMRWDERRAEFRGGRIMDPKSGRVYRSAIWQDPNDANLLRVRGMIGPFGRTQVWHVMPYEDLPPELQDLDVSGWEVMIIE